MCRGRGAERGLKCCHRDGGQVADRAQSQPGEHLAGALANAPERRDRQRMQEVQDAGGRNHEQAVRLAVHRGQLRHELGRCDAYRAGDAELLVHLPSDASGDEGGPAEKPDSAGDVEERLVQ